MQASGVELCGPSVVDGLPTGALNGSAEMNVWLHKQVMTNLAESGGVVPDGLPRRLALLLPPLARPSCNGAGGEDYVTSLGTTTPWTSSCQKNPLPFPVLSRPSHPNHQSRTPNHI